jgi:methionyl-tRNA formyltransferase
VVTAPARPSGRGRKLVPSPVESAAVDIALPHVSPENPNDPQFVSALKDADPAACVLVAYGYILKETLLDVPRLGFFNLHPSLLPAYRGAAPIQRSLMDGVTRTGISVIAMSWRVDAGDIVAQQPVEVGPDETAGELSARLAEAGARLLAEVLKKLAAGTPLPRAVQDPSRATTAPKIAKPDRVIHWASPAAEIHNRIRALSPEPGAVTHFRDRQLVLLRSRIADSPVRAEPGTILDSKTGLLVAAGTGAVELLELRPEGGKTQSGKAFSNGHRPAPGERLETQ